MHFNSLECKKIGAPALSQVRQGVLFIFKNEPLRRRRFYLLPLCKDENPKNK